MDFYKDELLETCFRDVFQSEKEGRIKIDEFTELEEILNTIRERFKVDDPPNILIEMQRLENYIEKYKFEINEIIINYNLIQILIATTVIADYDPEQDPTRHQIALSSFRVVEMLFYKKKYGFILYFVEKNYISIIIENLTHLDPERLILALKALNLMIYNYPFYKSEVLKNDAIPILVDLVVTAHDDTSMMLTLWLLFNCTIEGAGPHLSEIISALEYLASLQMPQITQFLFYISSNICISRPVAVAFANLPYFNKLINKAMICDNIDLKSASYVLITHILTWYYEDASENDPTPRFNYKSIVRNITRDVEEEVAEESIETIANIIRYGDIGLILLSENLIERLDDVYEDVEVNFKTSCALIHSVILHKGNDEIFQAQFEHNALKMMVYALEGNNQEANNKILGALIIFFDFLSRTNQLDAAEEQMNEIDGFDTLLEHGDSENPSLSSKANAILMLFEENKE
ncbi:hypothetical protein TVAG_014180 [Trichomonas vaginalis G3]|uniref:Uncharacterized protein n=1 Tax=Trichomonas vaginalis (strain ATCC PRA-98 / G3) TaxID=412133 RepID=A2DDH2_TRIV3|nr:armadillo (ARM) repeat-containing protein family [Trichomonas vaginalis G3]EAY21651.1 hypothetical protein TVAG_014180 [Trichomonas vaginalis G3]KAI5489673.1 armadillo (ARM) repeat-containing protein family [Trichomonas vaginalis G3]|eukprot:XP_001582637.1 hypothetical protein [Trichomonas vaginalis G3]